LQKVKILFLSCGSVASYHFINTLKKLYSNYFYIVGADINEKHLVPVYDLVDEYHKVSNSDEEGYYSSILEIIKAHGVDFLFPVHDIDQILFYPENKDLLLLGVTSFGVPEKTRRIYESKISMFNYLLSKGLPVPMSYGKHEIIKDEDYFVKPIRGYGSQEAKMMKGFDILKHTDFKKFICQEICFFPEITLECFFVEGVLFTVARERISQKSGVCVKARVYHDEYLHGITCLFSQHIYAPPFFNLQFMSNKEGIPVITDINLRMPAGMSMSYSCGWDVVSGFVDLMLSRPINYNNFKIRNKEVFVVRTYKDIITKTV
jgi:carbamoyl-phosphate synthase large subunit